MSILLVWILFPQALVLLATMETILSALPVWRQSFSDVQAAGQQPEEHGAGLPEVLETKLELQEQIRIRRRASNT